MKKLVLAALAASAAIATPAFAGTPDTGTVTVTGSVGGKCLFTTKTASIDAGELAGADGKLNATPLTNPTKTLAGWCNQSASKMTVTAKPLFGSTPTADSNFTNRIDINAQATAAGVTATDTSSGDTDTVFTPGDPQTVGIFSGNIDVKITSATAGGKILTQGSYNGSIDVTLTPAV